MKRILPSFAYEENLVTEDDPPQPVNGAVPDDMDLWDVAVAVVRGKLTLSKDQMRVLIEMFPYLRSKLSTTTNVNIDGTKSFAEALDRCIERSRSPVLRLNGPVEPLPPEELKRPFQRTHRRF
jgi:hypothetical protein